MDLFSESNNLLPYDGEAVYYGAVLSQADAAVYFKKLIETIEWKHDEVIIFGKKVITSRKVAWYGNAGYEYTYSNITRHAIPFTKQLLELKEIVEAATGNSFNSCLLNLYHNGNEGMSWHSDNEKELGNSPIIASVSLGAPRKFIFKHKINKEKREVVLQNGSLLVMKGSTQTHWLHALPKTKVEKNARINLTFRTIKT